MDSMSSEHLLLCLGFFLFYLIGFVVCFFFKFFVLFVFGEGGTWSCVVKRRDDLEEVGEREKVWFKYIVWGKNPNEDRADSMLWWGLINYNLLECLLGILASAGRHCSHADEMTILIGAKNPCRMWSEGAHPHSADHEPSQFKHSKTNSNVLSLPKPLDFS